jgi:hypothetical protein
MKEKMKRKTYLILSLSLAGTLALILIVLVITSSNKLPHTCDGYDRSIISYNVLEDRYIVKESEYTIATYGGDPIKKPIVYQFNNISRQKTLNARLNAFNEMVEKNPNADRNEQLYQSYKIHQMNYYLFSCEYFTAFDTTVTNNGVNMIIGSEIDGTLLMNFPALLGNDTDSWKEFFSYFEEARTAAGAKEITMEYMATDNVGFVFEGENLTDLTLRVLYKIPDDTVQQEVPMKLNDIKWCLSEKMRWYMSFTEDASMTYEEYARLVGEYKGYYE